jgi:glycerophosphoryl diester phosphodiesterase
MPLIVGHRGAPRRAHENTLVSFEAAIADGVDMVELDVRKTGDDTLIIHHDPWLSRRTRKWPLRELSYAKLLERTARRNFVVPTLEETLRALRGRVLLDIELKEPGYEKRVVDLARSYFPSNSVVLTSFNPDILAEIKRLDPGCTTGLIFATADNIPQCLSCRYDFLVPQYRLYRAHRNFFLDAKNRGVKIAVWTVDRPLQLKVLLKDPLIDAVITNRPDRAVVLRDQR